MSTELFIPSSLPKLSFEYQAGIDYNKLTKNLEVFQNES